MSTLYSYASANIRRTYLLFVVFLGFLIGVGFIFSQALEAPAILWIVVAFSTILSLVSFFWSDRIAIGLSGAREISDEHNLLYDIVENLAITAGLPKPRLYIIPELAINAFATGRDPAHGVVAVTEGALEKLERSELEGVVAHEMSHIKNRDTLVATIAVVLAGFIAIAADFFLRTMFWGGGRRRDRGSGATGIFILIGIILAILAPIFAQLVQLAISRKREFLADASGSLLTRYPEGLASALEKIGRDATPMTRVSHATAHLYLSNPFRRSADFMARIFSTHPPLEERIRILRS
ncbi:MAG: M48 family metallopeptidase [Parcubacteria group bacterium]|nr:M48 family metallopeptidase [Parcubacteria group bacterium]